VVLLVFIALIVSAPRIVSPDENLTAYLTYVFSMCGVLIFICWKKGEKPRWRWGRK